MSLLTRMTDTKIKITCVCDEVSEVHENVTLKGREKKKCRLSQEPRGNALIMEAMKHDNHNCWSLKKVGVRRSGSNSSVSFT